ncbi:hypothetical protein PTKIN_Ptkin13bG0117100 [Pterospermum kingtungense]
MPSQKIETGNQDTVHDVAMDFYGKRIATGTERMEPGSFFPARADGGWDASRIDRAHPAGVTSVSWAPSMAPGALVGSGLLDPVQKLCSEGCDSTVKVWKLYKMDCFPALQMPYRLGTGCCLGTPFGVTQIYYRKCITDGKVITWTVAKEGDRIA